MEKTTEWRPGPPLSTVCRCCLAESCYKDISTEYFWMGKREVYSEMLSETFDISISYSQSGGPNSNSRLICELCISRLRDASDFKKQVQECEKTFMQHLDLSQSVIELEIPPTPVEKEVKLEQVKKEKRHSVDDFNNDAANFPDATDFADAHDDDDDDLDDQPLTKLASKLPKKETVDILELLENNKVTVKRKSSNKLKTSPSKKSKSKEKSKTKVVKASASKTSKEAKPQKKKKALVSRLVMAKRNAEIVLRSSTVYPFRLTGNSMMCVYCCEEYESPKQYRKHIDENHQDFTVSTAFAHCGKNGKEMLKVDCTNLLCRICVNPFENITEIAKHLYEDHDKSNLDLNYEIGLQPYKLEDDKWICYICKDKLPSITKLCRHTTSHYQRFTCDLCGRCYLTMEALKYHIRCSHSNSYTCRKCWEQFPSLEKKKEHMKVSKQCWSFCCVHCGERFTSWEIKQKHLVQVHGKPVRKYECPDCPSVFVSRKLFYSHFKLNHTDEGFTCSCCGLKFDTKKNLEIHTIGHTGEKPFACLVCLKSFSREKCLKQHLWIHNEDKRFVCSVCDKKFAQKVSLKGHMKSHHPEATFECC